LALTVDTWCHLCSFEGVEVFEKFERLPRVTSDCQPWPAGGRLGICGRCGSVQHLVDPCWRAEIGDIYNRYDVYYQAAGDEQKTFAVDGASGPRSARLVRYLQETASLPRQGSVLDYGCGNGAFLKAFRQGVHGWTLVGADIGERHRCAIEEIDGAGRYVNLANTADPGTGFDLITMSHCLEHLEGPVALLSRMRGWLSARGRLMIQVPHVLESPFDLLVADHCSHFTTATLATVLEAAGYDVLHLETSVVPKEITAVARPGSREMRAPAPASAIDVASVSAFVRGALRWLEAVMAERQQLASQGKFGIFGTSIAGVWVYGVAPEGVDFFVDEDQSRIGRRIDRIPIVHPTEVESDASVFLAMPVAIAQRIYRRLRNGPGRYYLPPSWPES
jgi:SAM-dependent methyltransferase